MQFNPAIVGRPRIVTQTVSRKSPFSRPSDGGSPQACEEIYAYIAARDMALAEAEARPSDDTVNRAFLANQLVENCLQPVRSTYQSQYLPGAEAIREGKRCAAATARITELRAGLMTTAYACAVAA